MKHWPEIPESDPVDYRPPRARQHPIDLDAAREEFNSQSMATLLPAFDDPPTLAIDPLDDIGSLVRSLTYGQMIDLAAALWSAKDNRDMTAETLPAILHAWAAGHD